MLGSLLTVLAIGTGWLCMKACTHAGRAPRWKPWARDFKYDFGLTYDADSVAHYNAAAKPPGPAIIRWLFGEHLFANIVGLGLSKEACEHLSPELLRELTAFDTLETLSLKRQPIGDSDLQFLRHLPNLKELDLAGTNISDETLRKLSGMRQLRS